MGNIDILSRKFLDDPLVVADLGNLLFFPDTSVIRPQDLSPCPVETSVALGRGTRRRILARTRDVLKRFVPGPDAPADVGEIFIGLEAQTSPDPAMPLRVLFYDASLWHDQITLLGKKGLWPGYPGGRKWSAALIPVRTLVVYFGLDLWDAPTSLGRLLKHPDRWPGRPLEFRIDVITLAELDDRQLAGCCPALQCVAKCLRCGRDKKALEKLVDEDEIFRRVPNSVMDLVNAILNTHIRKSRNKETTDMRHAIQDLFDDKFAEGIAEGKAVGIAEGKAVGIAEGEARGKAVGIAEGKSETIREFVRSYRRSRMSRKRIQTFLVKHFSLKPEEAMTYL